MATVNPVECTIGKAEKCCDCGGFIYKGESAYYEVTGKEKIYRHYSSRGCIRSLSRRISQAVDDVRSTRRALYEGE